MRYLLALLVVSLLLLPALSLLHLGREIRAVKYEMKRNLVSRYSSNAMEIRVQKTELAKNSEVIFHKEENELEIRGQMYDIISISESRDAIVYICVADKQETELKSKLLANLTDFLGQNTPQKKQNSEDFRLFQISICLRNRSQT